MIITKINLNLHNNTYEGVRSMKTFLGSLYHLFLIVNKTQIIWCGAFFLILLMLAILHHFWKNDSRKIRLWRLLCLIPIIGAAVHAYIHIWGFPTFAIDYIPLYLIAVSALIPIPFAKRKIGYRITAALTGVVSVLCGLYFCFSLPLDFNHTRQSYTDSFHSLVQDMDKNYVLKEWKEVDFNALEEKYMPIVQEAEQEHDPVKFADAVRMFCNELHDGHVSVMFKYNDKEHRSAIQRHEYGLAMMQLDNNDVIAVCTVAEVNALGIEDGTIITKWNGKPVLQAAAEDVMDHGLPVKANDDRIAAMVLSGIGGETVDVSFLDKSGKEQTVTLSDLGEMHTYKEADCAFSHSPINENDEEINFSTKMLNDKCGYLRLSSESTDSTLHDILAYLNGDHKWAREMFREKLRDLKDKGMEYLVVDLRNNGGGFDEIACALCDLLTAEDWYGQGLGIRKNGQYICVSDHGIHGDGEFADLPVVALTNYNCASAGDGASLYLSRLPNVTVAGITDPCGCNQETGGICVLSDGLICVDFPVGLVLNENGDPNIDTRADRISRNPVEVRIPLNYEAAMKMFHDKEDHELAWAIKYLEDQAK